ncbi:MAG: aminodeoxychorismate/anthranilate synthase component II [Thermoplasmata archaeon]
MQRILIVDNYDSFVYNLVQYFGELGCDVIVVRNDVSLEEVQQINPDKIVIGPGPGRPENSGVSLQIIEKLGPHVPVLGICLGHQAIAYIFGGKIIRSKVLLHGKQSTVYNNMAGLFTGLPPTFKAVRYHSLIVSKDGFPSQLMVMAKTEEEEIMALMHRDYPLYGLQFHPESVLNECGKDILKSFLEVNV